VAEHPWGEPDSPEDTAYDVFGRRYSLKGYDAYERGARAGPVSEKPSAAPAAAATPPRADTEVQAVERRAGTSTLPIIAGVVAYAAARFAFHSSNAMALGAALVVAILVYGLTRRS